MGTMICVNTSCGVTAASEWKKGWKLKSGQIAHLCFKCGSAYEKLVYCDTFHNEETGWRECSLCNKRLHCGCIASLPFLEIQDFGGVWCINCVYSVVQRDDLILSAARAAKIYTSNVTQNPQPSNNLDADSLEEGEKSSKTVLQPGQSEKLSEANKGLVSQTRIARPPVEAKVRNQLHSRFWPRITDQELQKLSEDLKSTVVPLFEKVLSASDASYMGRMVLPKAGAEEYFPHIKLSEGLPLKIQDVKGNEWEFQFRFWPNYNSRMYVLDGMTPFIRSMQLVAGDTVTFSRIDPGVKLVMGCRKASNSNEMQDQSTSASHNGTVAGDSFFFDKDNNQSAADNGILQSNNGRKEDVLNVSSARSNMEIRETHSSKNEKLKVRLIEDSFQHKAANSDKKKSLNKVSKNKRLAMHSEEPPDLQVTWEEAQDLLHPPPSVQPNIVTIGEFDFEEYNEPPVFGKRTLFTNGLSGSFCSTPELINFKELVLYKPEKDSKKQKAREFSKLVRGREPTTAGHLDALATAAAAAYNSKEPSSSRATTRHPRHRIDCTCIVCNQPLSGKGNHKPSKAADQNPHDANEETDRRNGMFS